MGGSSTFLFYFLKYLDRKKFTPFVLFYFKAQGPDVEKIKSLEIEVYSLDLIPPTELKSFYFPFLKKFTTSAIYDLWFSLIKAFSVVKIIKRKNIKILIFNNDLNYHLIGLLAAKISHIPCICRKAGVGGGKKIKRVFGRFVDKYVAISDAAIKDYLADGLPKEKLLKIYEGVDLEIFDPSKYNGSKIKKEFRLENKKIITSISRLTPSKGQMEIIKAASIVTKKHPNVIFLIVGEDVDTAGSFRKKLEKEVEKLGIKENVIFTGWRKDIPEILAATDIFVHYPSGKEALSIANLEAMAMEKPTIVSNNEGLAEAVIDGETGFIVPLGDINALANAILKLIKNKNLSTTMGKNARKRVEELFDIKKNVKVFENVIISLV